MEADIGEDYSLIEQIVDRRVVKGEKRYLVKWVGWSRKYNSWIAAGDLSAAAAEMAAEFDEEQEDKQTKEQGRTTRTATSHDMWAEVRQREIDKARGRKLRAEARRVQGAVTKRTRSKTVRTRPPGTDHPNEPGVENKTKPAQRDPQAEREMRRAERGAAREERNAKM